jgi:hypothetical protein
MAYNDTGGTVIARDMCPVMGLPGVLPVVLNNSAATTDVLLDIPWKNCRLAHAMAVVTTAIDAAGSMVVDIELNAAGGGDIMSLEATASAAIGTQYNATFDDATKGDALDRDNADRDKLNIEVNGSTTGTGQLMLYMFFEPSDGVTR